MASAPRRSGLRSPAGLACLLVFLHYVGAYMRMPLVPLYASAGGASPSHVGLVMGAFMVVAAAGAIPGGLLADRVGRRRPILAGVALSTAASVALPLSQGVPFLMAVLALAGWGMAAFSPAVMAYIGETGGRERPGRAYGWYTTSLYGGMSLGPACGGVAAGALGYRAAFLLSGGVLLASTILAARSLPDVGRPGQGPGPMPLAAGGGARPWIGIARVVANPLVAACWGAMFCFTFAWGALLAFLPLYLAGVAGLSPRAIGGLFALQGLWNMGLRTPVGSLSDRLGVREPFIVGGLAAFAAATALVPLLEAPWALAVAVSLTGIGQGVGAVATGAALGEATDPSQRGAAMGGYSTALYGGMAAGSFLVGPVIARAGFPAGFGLSAAVLLAGAGAFHLVARRARRAASASRPS